MNREELGGYQAFGHRSESDTNVGRSEHLQRRLGEGARELRVNKNDREFIYGVAMLPPNAGIMGRLVTHHQGFGLPSSEVVAQYESVRSELRGRIESNSYRAFSLLRSMEYHEAPVVRGVAADGFRDILTNFARNDDQASAMDVAEELLLWATRWSEVDYETRNIPEERAFCYALIDATSAFNYEDFGISEEVEQTLRTGFTRLALSPFS